jgi:hypothetical protein
MSAQKLVKENYEEARYRFKQWTKEDYFNSYLNHQDIQEEKKKKLEGERLKKQREEEEREERKRRKLANNKRIAEEMSYEELPPKIEESEIEEPKGFLKKYRPQEKES